MKKTILLLATVLALASCDKKGTPDPVNDGSKYTAAIKQDWNTAKPFQELLPGTSGAGAPQASAATRSFIGQPNGICWEKDDRIYVWSKCPDAEQYVRNTGEAGPNGDFVRADEPHASCNYTTPVLTRNYAFAPVMYSDGVWLGTNGEATQAAPFDEDDMFIEFTLPATQVCPATFSFTAGQNIRYDNQAYPFVGTTPSTNDTGFEFRRVSFLWLIGMRGEGQISQVRILANGNETLHGRARVQMKKGAAPRLELQEADGGNYGVVTLDCHNAGVILDDQAYTYVVIAVPPVTLPGGFTVEIAGSNDSGSFEKRIERTFEFVPPFTEALGVYLNIDAVGAE